MSLHTVHTVADLRAQVSSWRAEGLKIALVPTMGALHQGHISLTTLARQFADRVIVSVFVNPTQFGPTEDFAAYPRTLPADQVILQDAGVELCFAPTVEEMYPSGFATRLHIDNMTDMLCGASRPGHFDGMAQVVSKLLLQALPDVALFGEKDYQQLMVIKRFVTDLNIPVSIIGGPIHREQDGLAMSSRNRYLSAHERQTATTLYQVLTAIADRAARGDAIEPLLETGRQQIAAAGFTPIDYLEIRDAETLDLMQGIINRPARVFVAARLGKARLIDNFAITPHQED
ncbi:pantoate--beta-alanine ligase [Thalassospira mesophila]|uniref:Pantothenate synthetase n=1 Tax=Thalassospira mesophila TaxID=1293891 RepID=A0A1Y2L1T1_9PROT|nr:pantoate--beta-alanine ligase [Thalassospira mesophila]OSQ39421.1 pantoate--beta-alanine ligase [Thalassospira mesophila]